MNTTDLRWYLISSHMSVDIPGINEGTFLFLFCFSETAAPDIDHVVQCCDPTALKGTVPEGVFVRYLGGDNYKNDGLKLDII